MASGPDLFVICKNCSAEVSPYITECPYCGARLRKRAPKLDKAGKVSAPRPRRPRLGPLRKGEIPGIRSDRPGRPYATGLLVLASVIATLLLRAGIVSPIDVVLGSETDPWRILTTTFFYFGTGYELLALAGVFLFGWLLERRHGLWVPLLVFALGAAAGNALAMAVDEGTVASGANGAALALLVAWAMRDALGRRRGVDDDSDLLGTLFFAAVLLLLPIAAEEAHPLAGLGGAAAGALLGLVLARLPER
jgi:membrane associated rhomboid family serine protease